jgi:hypothetical protein
MESRFEQPGFQPVALTSLSDDIYPMKPYPLKRSDTPVAITKRKDVMWQRIRRRPCGQDFLHPLSCLTIILSILMGLALPGVCEAEKHDTVLVTEDGTTAPIIVAKNAPPHTIKAVEELARLIEKISGHRPEILNVPPNPLPTSTIWVGPHPSLAKAMPGVDFQLTKPEETLYVSQGGQVAILGMDKMIGDAQSMSGSANAVYSFAQEVLGCPLALAGRIGGGYPRVQDDPGSRAIGAFCSHLPTAQFVLSSR